MALNAFRAGSGSYQQVIPLQLAVTSIPPFNTAVETYATPVQGALTGLTVDSMCEVMVDSASSELAVNGLVPLQAQISATGVLQITWENLTNTTLAPGTIQVNLLVF